MMTKKMLDFKLYKFCRSNDIYLTKNPILTEAVIGANDIMYLMDSNSGKLFSTYITTLRYTPIKLMEQQSGKKVGFLMGLYCITLGRIL